MIDFYRIKNDKKISQIQWHRTAYRECRPGASADPRPSTHQLHLSTWAKHLLLQCPVILLTSKLPNICTHIHEYNIQKCSKVIWKIRNILTNKRCRSSCWKQVTQPQADGVCASGRAAAVPPCCWARGTGARHAGIPSRYKCCCCSALSYLSTTTK